METNRPAVGSRLGEFIYGLLLGILLYMSGFFLVLMGDGPSNWPSYHAGGILISGLLPLFVYTLFASLSPPLPPLNAPRIQAFYVIWLLVGAGLMSLTEKLIGSECCSNPEIRQKIFYFSVAWPLAFVIVPFMYYVWDCIRRGAPL